MSGPAPTPPPLTTPDGKEYWDGSRWVPVPESGIPISQSPPPAKPMNTSSTVAVSPPPPPIVSPDGRFYWDGDRWVSTAGSVRPPSRSTAVGIVVIVGLVIVGVLVWYFGYYDTAAAKCNRGDIGACLVVAGQQAAQAAAVASASAVAQASADAAAAQQRVDEINRLQVDMLSGCTVVSDPNHNMRLTYIGPNSAANCASAKKQGWIAANRVDGSGIVCADESRLVVEDTGGWALGTDLCGQLNLPIWPSN